MGLWSTQAKVEAIELKAAWHWDDDSSVINDPLGNQAAPIVCRHFVCVGLCGWKPYIFSHFVGQLL